MEILKRESEDGTDVFGSKRNESVLRLKNDTRKKLNMNKIQQDLSTELVFILIFHHQLNKNNLVLSCTGA